MIKPRIAISVSRANQHAAYGLVALFATPFAIHFPFSLSMNGALYALYLSYKFSFCGGVISCIAIASFPVRKWGVLGVIVLALSLRSKALTMFL
jgi:hypothetical protein